MENYRLEKWTDKKTSRLQKQLVDYPFGSEKIMISWAKSLKLKLFGKSIINLVLLEQETVVGLISAQRVSDDIIGIWNIFVNPSFRGRGLSKIIYRLGFDYIASKNIKKSVGLVAHNNIASLKSIKDQFDGLFDTSVFIGQYDNTNYETTEFDFLLVPLQNTSQINLNELLDNSWLEFYKIHSIEELTWNFKFSKPKIFFKLLNFGILYSVKSQKGLIGVASVKYNRLDQRTLFIDVYLKNSNQYPTELNLKIPKKFQKFRKIDIHLYLQTDENEITMNKNKLLKHYVCHKTA